MIDTPPLERRRFFYHKWSQPADAAFETARGIARTVCRRNRFECGSDKKFAGTARLTDIKKGIFQNSGSGF